jgi:hypothetical protein
MMSMSATDLLFFHGIIVDALALCSSAASSLSRKAKAYFSGIMKYSAAIVAAAAVTSAAAALSEHHRSLRYSKAGKSTKAKRGTSYGSGGSYYSFSLNNNDVVNNNNVVVVGDTPVDNDSPPKERPPKEEPEEQPPILIPAFPPQVVVGITSKETLDDPTSPQARAFHWITNDDGMALDIDSPEWIQRYIMASFYYATGGDNWEECNAPKVRVSHTVQYWEETRIWNKSLVVSCVSL